MPRFNKSVNSFVAGQISPKMQARTDTTTYAHGLNDAKNVLIHPQGGASKRPGTEFVIQTALNVRARLIPFQFSESEAYCLEITPGLIRVINTSSKKVVSSIEGATKRFPTKFHVFTDYNVPYTALDLDAIQYAQSGDLVYLVHPSYPPLIVFRDGVDSFGLKGWNNRQTDSITAVEGNIWEAYSYRDANTDTNKTITLSSKLVGAGVTLSANFDLLHYDPSGDTPNNSYHVQTIFAHDGGFFLVSSVQDSRTAVVEVLKEAANAATTDWAESSWNDYRGWPRTVCFFESRLYLGGNASQPDTVWGSQTNDIYEFLISDATEPTDPFAITIASVEASEIQWMSPGGQSLNVGTRGREYILTGADGANSFNATNSGVRAQTTHGSAHVQAIRAGGVVTFIQRSFQKVMEFVFNFDEDNYRARDIILQSENLPSADAQGRSEISPIKIINMAYQDSDNGIIWFIDNTGGLVGCTRNRTQQVIAWHRYVPGGSLSGESPKVHSVATLPSANGTTESLWMVVERTINSETVFSVERMLSEYKLPTMNNTDSDIQNKPVYMDMAYLDRQSAGTLIFSGFWSLIGETVQVLADGGIVSDKVVTVGANNCSNGGAETDTSGWSAYSDVLSGTHLSGGFSITSSGGILITFASAHGLLEGQRFIYSSDTTDIGGMSSGTEYTARAVTANTFKVSDTLTGDLVNMVDYSSTGAGEHSFSPSKLPIDATGGSPSLTISRDSGFTSGGTESDYLTTGTACFRMRNPGSDVSGQGVSYDFSIDALDANKFHEVSFDWTSDDLTFQPDDGILISIYDVDNSQHIEFVTSGIKEIHPFKGRFLASDSVNYRLVFSFGESAAAVANLHFDEVVVRAPPRITLESSEAATEIIAGLGYQARIETLDLDAGGGIGSSIGALKRIERLVCRFSRTVFARVGRDDATLEDIDFRETNLAMDQPTPLFTGDKVINFPGDTDRKAVVVVESSKPLPMTISGVIIRGIEHD